MEPKLPDKRRLWWTNNLKLITIHCFESLVNDLYNRDSMRMTAGLIVLSCLKSCFEGNVKDWSNIHREPDYDAPMLCFSRSGTGQKICVGSKFLQSSLLDSGFFRWNSEKFALLTGFKC
ncbi:hypothetical protein SADUNF_Sadunf05G0158400 [Salix dunnii]|uniref:Uncharacterized protein n=1 Tax=Salix dunnii TaxID=1413687 RepID=A0A835MZM8_9ROSI|nr:hypothetical protein SADUNF_Sadunf05G0158400 [Salix dunnii]